MASFTTWTIFLVLFSTFFVSKIADGNEQYSAQLTEASHAHATGWDGNTGTAGPDEPVTQGPPTEIATEESTVDATESAPPPPPAAPSCDVTSISSALTEKIETLEKKVESLVSQLTENLETKLTDIKSSVATTSGTPSSPSPSPSSGNNKIQESFTACLEALKSDNVPEAVKQWDEVEKGTFGPTAKATLLKDIFFLAYENSRIPVIKFAQELINSSKKYLPSVFDLLTEATKLNAGNLFSLGSTIKNELGMDSPVFQKLPEPVRLISSGNSVQLTFVCKTSQKKLEMHVRDDELNWGRSYWPVVASHSYNLNHTKGAIWSFEAKENGNFNVKNSWFGDFLWVEPYSQNLRTVDAEKNGQNGTEFKVTLTSDSNTILLHSVFYKDAPVVEGFHSRNPRDSARPLRVDLEQTGIKFNVEFPTKAR